VTRISLALGVLVVVAAPRFGAVETQPVSVTPVFRYDIVNSYPHDPEAFTQGLVFRDGALIESTGRNGRSTLRRVQLETGNVLQQTKIDDQYFAEGLTDWGNRLIQLTWVTNVGFVYDLGSFKRLQTFKYDGEGWGLTHDGRRLIMSDGTPTLRFLDPESLKVTGRVTVRDRGRPVDDLNELEFVNDKERRQGVPADGLVYANVWTTDRIAMINPESGEVVGWIDLSGLMPPAFTSGDAVLNGIAWDAGRQRLFVTGKLWPRLFEVRIRR
jgi:glutamine cyclotransferase